MKLKLLFLLIFILLIFGCTKSKEVNMEYQKSFDAARAEYPFERWQSYVKDGSDQYTKENCNKAKDIMDKLIQDLAVIGIDAKEENKVKKFEIAVKAYNNLNEDTDYSSIETGEREELFEIFEMIARFAGIDSQKYGDGEGIASEWRDW